MSTVRAALKTTLAALTYNSETAKGFDHGSTELALANMESSSFNNEVGIFIGDETPRCEYHSPAYYTRYADYEILIAEKRVALVPNFETYASEFYETLPGSNLGGNVANLIQIEITGESKAEKVASVWIKRMYVTVTHLMPITLGADFRINLEKPTITIDKCVISGTDWIATLSTTKGTGTLDKLYVVAVDSLNANKQVGDYLSTVAIGENTATLGYAVGSLPSGTATIYAVVTDQYGACGEATPLLVTPV